MRILLVILLGVILTGCATAVDKYLREHPDTPPNIRSYMLSRQPCVGMTKEQVIVTFGGPIETTWDKVDNKESWAYRYYYGYYSIETLRDYDTYYFAFDNDKLVRIEKSDEKAERERKYEIEKYIQQHPERSEFKNVILEKKIRIGMNKDEVRLSWGKPRDINRTVTIYGTSEQWIYGSLNYANYLYFDDSILTSWQD